MSQDKIAEKFNPMSMGEIDKEIERRRALYTEQAEFTPEEIEKILGSEAMEMYDDFYKKLNRRGRKHYQNPAFKKSNKIKRSMKRITLNQMAEKQSQSKPRR